MIFMKKPNTPKMLPHTSNAHYSLNPLLQKVRKNEHQEYLALRVLGFRSIGD